jgi:hypothetical protein
MGLMATLTNLIHAYVTRYPVDASTIISGSNVSETEINGDDVNM